MKLLPFIKFLLITTGRQLYLAVKCFAHLPEKMSQKCGEKCAPCFGKIAEKLKKEEM